MSADEPLTPEERALAERLRLGRQASPSPALDAAILAAARAAVATAPVASSPPDSAAEPAAAATPVASATAPAPVDHARTSKGPRRRARWPAWTGLAASLTLAVGIAWQLRTPTPPVAAPVVPDAAAPAPAASETAAEQAAAAQPAAAEDASAAADAASAPTAMPPPPPASVQKLAPAANDRAAPAPPAAPANAPAVAEPAPMMAPPPAPAMVSPPAPPAPPAPPKALAPPAPMPQGLAKPAARTREADAMQREDRRMLQRRSENLTERDGGDAASAQPQEAEGYAARVERNLSATPAPAPAAMPAAPVAADSAPAAASARASGTDPALAAAESDAHLSPRRWLARIRERRDAGEQAAARASLQRFQREHPHARIPDDLRELLGD